MHCTNAFDVLSAADSAPGLGDKASPDADAPSSANHVAGTPPADDLESAPPLSIADVQSRLSRIGTNVTVAKVGALAAAAAGSSK